MIFLTVGTQFPFDRLVQAVDEAVDQLQFSEPIFAQTGQSRYSAKNIQTVESLEKDEYDRHFNSARAVISHAGVGTITMALKMQKPLLVLPRLKQFSEVVNNHQVALANKFSEMGHLIMADREDQVLEKLGKLLDFQPRARETQVDIVQERLGQFLSDIKSEKMLTQKA